ncbi:SulP family inorganic anion transporter [Uliginosibacterium sp. 31-16]|uniref:SulP family inorganic anion transporter n=1 Tax=Uliginosibacterium sp. 31-16 TaxID=3068315 RepID=UPI00273E39EA|nr:SulP family inorganic anion transporter [Uliginosibacterium sp. 31-16]MDP5240106.1 SulP family inorganic anion transporter [Uliginosibacterium sp. 31-16]
MLQFHPKLQDALRGYSRSIFFRDLSAGVTVGVLALPLAMAFAIASGVSPSAGIWTAIIAGFIISAFGGSLVQIGGPTGAFIPILYGIVAAHGISNMLAATFMAGIMLLVMGLTRMGNLIRFIPISVVIGFTNGIGVVLMLSQIKDFFGMGGGALPAEFFARMQVLAGLVSTINPYAAGLGAGTVVLKYGWDALVRRCPRAGAVPALLMALLLGTVLSVLLELPVETIGSRFNGIPQGLPAIAFPLPALSSLGSLLAPAITIALLGAIESLLSARVADPLVEDRHDPNQELLAQGLANIASPFFGGIAATGAIARTSTNVRAGGRTPVAGIVHALTLLVIVLAAAPLAAWVPIPVLAAIVIVTAVRMGEWHEFVRLKHFSWNYRIILLATFFLTVLFDLTIAVEIGMVLASLFFIYRMQDLTTAEVLGVKLRPGLLAFDLRGSLFFGAVAKLDAQIDPARLEVEVLVLNLREVLNIDTSGIDWLQGLQKALIKKGATLVLCGLGAQPQSLVRRSGLIAQLGVHNVCDDIDAALHRAREIQDETE